MKTPPLLQVVEKGGPYPLIVLPQFGGYWIEDPENVGTPTSLGSSVCEEEEEDGLSPSTFGYKLECKSEARAYRRHFLGKVRPGAPVKVAAGVCTGTPHSALVPPPCSCSFLVPAACLCPWRGLTGSAGQGTRFAEVWQASCGGSLWDHPQQMFWEAVEWAVIFGGGEGWNTKYVLTPRKSPFPSK